MANPAWLPDIERVVAATPAPNPAIQERRCQLLHCLKVSSPACQASGRQWHILLCLKDYC